jgi:hypothetical protein
MRDDRTQLRSRSREVLRLIARGHSYEQILAAIPGLTYRDIFRAAHEALKLLGPDDEGIRRNQERESGTVTPFRLIPGT